MDNELENLFDKIGKQNKYQYLTLSILFILNGLTEFLLITLPFLEAKPIVTYTNEDNIRVTSPIDYNICKGDYTIDYSESKSSMVLDFELYCNKTLTSLLGVSLFTGIFIGAYISHFFSDTIGRKKTIIIFTLMYVVMNVGFFLCPSNLLVLLYTLLFLSGVAYSIVALTAIILLNEFISKNIVAMFTSIIYSAFSFCGIFYTILFVYIENWRIMFLIIGGVDLLVILIFYLYVEESPRFYMTNNNKIGFLHTIKEIAKKNNRTAMVDEYLLNNNLDYFFFTPESSDKNSLDENKIVNSDTMDINDKSSGETLIKRNITVNIKYSAFDLIKYKSQRTNFLVLCYLWFASALIFYGLSINIKNIHGDMYKNGVIIFSIDIGFTFLAGFISNTETFGRKKTIILLLLVSFVSYMTCLFFEDKTSDIFSYALLLSRTVFTSMLCIKYFLSNEIYPTVLRAKGLGLNSAVSKVGGLIAPFIIEHLEIQGLLVTFCILNLFGIMLAFLLPETQNKPMYSHIPELTGATMIDDDNKTI